MTTTTERSPGRHKLGPGPWCGTPGGYSNHRCRCDECTAAWAQARRDYMARNPEQREAHRARTRDRRITRRQEN